MFKNTSCSRSKKWLGEIKTKNRKLWRTISKKWFLVSWTCHLSLVTWKMSYISGKVTGVWTLGHNVVYVFWSRKPAGVQGWTGGLIPGVRESNRGAKEGDQGFDSKAVRAPIGPQIRATWGSLPRLEVIKYRSRGFWNSMVKETTNIFVKKFQKISISLLYHW